MFKPIYVARLMLLCSAVVASAQDYRATITGTVADPQGATVPNAVVEARNIDTTFVTKSASNASGLYSIQDLLPGNYDVKITAPGFKEFLRPRIELHSGDKIQVDATLQLGAASETVTVSADTDSLQTATASIGQVVNQSQTEDLPLLGRNTFMLASLSTGVASGLYNEKVSQYGRPFDGAASQMSVGGIGSQAYQILLNGVPNAPVERASGATYIGFVPSPDAVEEVNFQSSIYDSQYGHSAGAVINTVMKSGSNNYHLRAYEFFRNEDLNASTFDANANKLAKPIMRWNQPGVVITGPLTIPKLYNAKDRTFFMISAELVRNENPTPSISSVPVAAEHTGNFSQLVQTNGQPILIYDPLTTTLTNGSYLRQPFAGNIIPASRINPVGQAMLNYYPLPNVLGNNTDFNNLIASPNAQVDKYYSESFRLDHQLNEHRRLSATVFNNVRHQLVPTNGFPAAASPGYFHFRNNHGGSLDYTDTLSPTLVLNIKYGFIFHPFQLQYYGDDFNIASLGFPQSLISQLPHQTFPGTSMSNSYTGLQNAASQYSTTLNHSLNGTVSKVTGKHTIKMGAEFFLMRANNDVPISNFGSFSFSAGFTQQNALNGSTSAGNPVASLILGYPSGGSVSYNIASAFQQLYYATFLQDDFRVSQRLTLNLGVRWDYESPMSERYNRQNEGFDFTDPNPIQSKVTGLSVPGGLLFTTASNRLPFKRDLNNFQPRIGAAYRLFANTVLRGGFGAMYMPTFNTGQNNGFSTTTSYVSSTDGNLTPATTLSNPYPGGIVVPSGSSLGLSTLLGQGFTFSDPNRTIPKVFNYSFGVQQLLPWRTSLDVAYVGNYASQLAATYSINALPASQYSLGSVALTTQVPNPMAGLLPGTSLNNATIPRQSLLVPFPEFGGISEADIPIGSSLYNSMQVQIQKRLSTGLQMRASYTWSKIMQETGYLNNGATSQSDLARVQSSEPSKILTISGSYELPIFTHRSDWLHSILGGWSLNVVARYQNGYLVGAPGGTYSSGIDPQLSEKTYSQWFNTCSVNTSGVRQNCASTTQPVAWIQQPSFTLRTLSTTLPGIRTVIPINADVALFKTFVLHEAWKLQFRANMYNLTNTAQFGGPSTSFGSATFGTTTMVQVNDPRFVELAAKILF